MNKKSYAELALLSTFLERFEYLKITGKKLLVGIGS